MPSDHWISDDTYYCNLVNGIRLVKVSGLPLELNRLNQQQVMVI